jgi:hypothetical protein
MKHINNFGIFSVEFEILNINNKILEKRGIDFYDYKNNGVLQKKQLSNIQRDKLKSIKLKVNNYLSKINNFMGVYTNNQGQIIKRYYKIEYDDHWLRKFLRKDIEDPNGDKNIKEPDAYEGINLIYNNRNKLTEYIFNKIIQNDFKVLVKATNKEGYELIFILKKEYKILFISQIKGIGHNFKAFNPNKRPINRIIKLKP